MKTASAVKHRSLTFKLLTSTLAALSGYVAVIGFLAYQSARDSIADTYDQSLIVNSNVLLFLMQKEAAEGELDKAVDLKISDENLKGEDKSAFAEMSEYGMFRVWHKDKLVLSSSDTPPALISQFPEGFSEHRIDGDEWRIYTLHSPSKDVTVAVGQQKDARDLLVLSIAADLVIPFLVSLPLIAFVFWRAITAGVSGLSKVTRQVDTRSPESMMPLETANLPADLMPLVEAINALLSRLSESLSRERQITELAAHELRTPLTAIKLQAQMGLRAANETERVTALGGLLDGVERAGHLVEQLLTLTRVEQSDYNLHSVDVDEAILRVTNELDPLSQKRRQKIVLSLEKGLKASANDDLLYLTLINMLGNAIKYAPEDSGIAIVTRLRARVIEIDILDEGPGIPESVRDKIFERFFRYHAGKVIGSGLGLTIARQCAERMNASLSLHPAETSNGLCARLTLLTFATIGDKKVTPR